VVAEIHKQERKLGASAASLSFDYYLSMISDHLVQGQGGAVVAMRLGDELAHYAAEADDGYFPRAELHPATMARLSVRHSTVKNLQALIRQELADFQSMADVAAAEGRLASRIGQARHQLPAYLLSLAQTLNG